ncbi:hypothetical protein XELAEV_18001775mg [Xenopus laevis]|nr:hypothetical protein XELAEV_18001775mg [Xenopus laevis]
MGHIETAASRVICVYGVLYYGNVPYSSPDTEAIASIAGSPFLFVNVRPRAAASICHPLRNMLCSLGPKIMKQGFIESKPSAISAVHVNDPFT